LGGPGQEAAHYKRGILPKQPSLTMNLQRSGALGQAAQIVPQSRQFGNDLGGLFR